MRIAVFLSLFGLGLAQYPAQFLPQYPPQYSHYWRQAAPQFLSPQVPLHGYPRFNLPAAPYYTVNQGQGISPLVGWIKSPTIDTHPTVPEIEEPTSAPDAPTEDPTEVPEIVSDHTTTATAPVEVSEAAPIPPFMNFPLETFAGTGSGRFDGNGLTGFVGDGMAGFNGLGANIFFGKGMLNANGDGNLNVMTTPQGAVGTYLGDGELKFDGHGGVLSFGNGAATFNGNGWGFAQGDGTAEFVGDIVRRTEENLARDGRTVQIFPISPQVQALLQPWNNFVDAGILASQNLAVNTLAQVNNIGTNTIALSQNVINGLANGFRNQNTFKKGGGNKPIA